MNEVFAFFARIYIKALKALAWHGKKLNIPVTVVMPRIAPQVSLSERFRISDTKIHFKSRNSLISKNINCEPMLKLINQRNDFKAAFFG